MARNAEKAMTTLARWRAAQQEQEKDAPQRKRRPWDVNECDNLADAEKFRSDIVRFVSKKVTQIQNAGLGEFRIRDLNDQINKLLREKRNWEGRISDLGGTNYRKAGGPQVDADGKEVPGTRGYKYFGAAKDLPGVRELFTQESSTISRKTRAELMRDVDADYYGFRDEDDGVIVPLEIEAEKEAIKNALGDLIGDREVRISDPAASEMNADDETGDFVGPRRFVSHVPSIPSQHDIRDELLRRRKEELLSKYVAA
ncbi:Pre-mRNA-splicing factor ISY1 -like protein [Halotydeus destructor]|nr:Pre-mRNA-splicing factor ISY1 -like protein [Halotydeus destructor]